MKKYKLARKLKRAERKLKQEAENRQIIQEQPVSEVNGDRGKMVM